MSSLRQLLADAHALDVFPRPERFASYPTWNHITRRNPDRKATGASHEIRKDVGRSCGREADDRGDRSSRRRREDAGTGRQDKT